VLRAHPQAFFVLAGEGPQRGAIERRAEGAGISSRLRLVGWRRDIADFYCAADVFALPSLWEGMSNALLEAAAAGLAIVATDVEGSPEVIRNEETGLIVPAGDPSALARALSHLIENLAEAKWFGRAAREHVLAKHSLESFIDAHVRLYLSLLGGEVG
jgi:glycosyltransferase involved in cell wall biosynthesis